MSVIQSIQRKVHWVIVLALACTGCWDASLPSTFDVRLPDGTSLTAARGSGIASLANSQWSVYSDPCDPYLVFNAEFGANGEPIRLFDNTINAEFVGSDLVGDGAVHPVPMPGFNYVGATYAAENESGLGFAAYCRIFIGPFDVGTCTVQCYGPLNSNRLEGRVEFDVQVNPVVESWGLVETGVAEWPIFAVPLGTDPYLPVDVDAYEPDDDWTQAKPIVLGESQTRSLAPLLGDFDWLVLTLLDTTSIVIETSGEYGDTRLWLYTADLSEIAFNDDGGTGAFSLIQVAGLPAGTYYIEVDEFGGDDCVPSYQIEVRQAG